MIITILIENWDTHVMMILIKNNINYLKFN
jgi:hypothetical protein